MALTDTDRRRFIAATVLTLLALPALWWANTSENSSAPNLAVAGIDAPVDAGASSADGPGSATGVDGGEKQVGEDFEAAAEPAAPVFLEGPASAAGAGQAEIAIPAQPLIEGISAEASFRSNVSQGTCIVGSLDSGTQITVVNLDNNRTTTCTTVLDPASDPAHVLMHTEAFASIADLTDAPISVEIRR